MTKNDTETSSKSCKSSIDKNLMTCESVTTKKISLRKNKKIQDMLPKVPNRVTIVENLPTEFM